MTISQLRVLLATIRYGRVSLAARALGVSQPSISQQLRKLATELGSPIIENRDGRVSPTAMGSQVVRLAELIVDAADRMIELSERGGLATSSMITVGGNTTGGMYIVPDIIRLFTRRYDDVAVRLVMNSANVLLQAVRSGTCDVAITGGPIEHEDVEVTTLFTERLALVAPPRHFSARPRTIELSDLQSMPLILPSLGSRTRLVVESSLRAADCFPSRIIEYPDTERVKKAVESGLGIAFLSREGVRRELIHGYLQEWEVSGLSIERPFVAIRHHHHPSPTLSEAFVEVARAFASLRARGG